MPTATAVELKSPGVFTQEIDQTGRATVPFKESAAIGGTCLQGPAFVPKILTTYSEFVSVFGNKNPSHPATYAAEEYLSNTTPMTFIRVLGAEDNPYADKSTSVSPNGHDFVPGTEDVASMALLKVASGSDASEMALLWLASGVSLTTVSGSVQSFLVVLSGAAAPYSTGITCSMDRTKSNYVERALNTDPLKFFDYGHYLRTTYSFASGSIATDFPNLIASGSMIGSTFVLDNTTSRGALTHAAFDVGYTTPKTPWVLSQHFGHDISGTPIYNKLFRFHTISDGEWANSNIKVEIGDIKKSSVSTYEFGSFTVRVRQADDTDVEPVVLEVFAGCNLDPDSDNYITKKIGNTSYTFDYTNRKLKQLGDYPNKSTTIRVEMSTELANTPATALPFGFSAYPALWNYTTGASTGSVGPVLVESQQIRLRYNVKKSWGLQLERSDVYKHDTSWDKFIDYTPINIAGELTESAADALEFFSLNYLACSGATNPATGSTALTTGQQRVLYLQQLPVAAADEATVEALQGTSAAKFCFTPFGGWNGLDLFQTSSIYAWYDDSDNLRSLVGCWDSDPSVASGHGGALTSNDEDHNAFLYSVKKAIEIVTDEETCDTLLLAVPGITNSQLNDYGLARSEYRGDCCFLLETAELNTTADEVETKRAALGYDSSYGATYFPHWKTYDSYNKTYVWLPATIAALKALAVTDSTSFPWYASAGLYRGVLPEALDVRYKTSYTERNGLQDNQINPIASFPREGIVIWGQKTLQTKETYLRMLHIRRLLIYAKRAVSNVAKYLVFEQDDQKTWDKFVQRVNPILDYVRAFRGIVRFKVVCDSTTNTQDLIDQQKMRGVIWLQPQTDCEIIELPFIISNNAADFSE